MIHGVPAPGLAARPYFNRYTEDAIDLCDVLSAFAPHSKASLNELSKIMGLLGKPEGIDGTELMSSCAVRIAFVSRPSLAYSAM